jgi:processing peptidase subunit beta
MRVVSLNNGSPLACVGLWVKVGSRFEKADQAGAAHFLEHMFFKGTNKRDAVGLEREVERIGAHVNAYTSREISAYFSDCFVKDHKQMVELISDCILNAQLHPHRVEIERNVIMQELESVEGVSEEVVYDYLHYTAFREQSIGRPILGTRADINAVNRDMLENFLKSQYTADRMVFVGVGDLNHEDFVKTVESNFANVATSSKKVQVDEALFTGSDYRHRLDMNEDVNFAYAFPYKGVNDPHFHALGVIGSMIGQYQYGNVHAQYAPSHLISKVAKEGLASVVRPVNMAYSDTGLFGVYAVTDPYHADALTCSIADELSSFVYEVEPSYFEWAKKAYLSDIMSHYRVTQTADILGNDLLNHNRVLHPVEVAQRVEAVTINDVKAAAEANFHDADFALAAFGNVYEMPDYATLRSRTYYKRF